MTGRLASSHAFYEDEISLLCAILTSGEASSKLLFATVRRTVAALVEFELDLA